MKPTETLAWLRARILSICGDAIENRTKLWAAHGYYYIRFPSTVPAKVRELNGAWRSRDLSAVLGEVKAAFRRKRKIDDRHTDPD